MAARKSINQTQEFDWLSTQSEAETETKRVTPTNSTLSMEEIEKDLDRALEKYQFKSIKEESLSYAKECTSKVIKLIATQDEIDPQTVLIGIAEILQSGGHTRGVTIRKAIVGNWDITKKQLINALNTTRCNCTLRSIARANKENIARISRHRRIPGNLYPQYQTYNPDIIKQPEEIQLEHAIYCVDFQKDNRDAPDQVLKFLNQREIDKKIRRK